MKGWIPDSLLTDVAVQPMMSVNKKDWLYIADKIISGIDNRITHLKSKRQEWENARKNVLEVD